MNPRRRRMLIPGLLIALLVVAAIASLTGRADGAEDPVSRLSDPRITESSGLAVSRDHEDLAYTINDSGNEPVVFAVRVSTGETVGVTRLDADLVDPEALALHESTLWVADIGDNRTRRPSVTLFSLPEPGPGDGAVTPAAHHVVLDEPADAEALLVDPEGTLFLVTKALGPAAVYRIADPAPGSSTRAERLEIAAPAAVTDGAYAPDGSSIALLTYVGVRVLDPSTWQPRATLPLPTLEQAETLSYTSARHLVVGSEGADSPLRRLELPTTGPDELAVVPGLGVVALVVAALGLRMR